MHRSNSGIMLNLNMYRTCGLTLRDPSLSVSNIQTNTQLYMLVEIGDSKLCGRPPQYAPAPLQVDF